MARVVLAMSGGVDSSVAAYLLKRQGHEVIGLFMRTGVHAHADDTPAHKKGCCSAVDAGDARRVADLLDLPFYALDFEQDFQRIMDYFVDEYAAGRTPNPCVVCNNWLKFGKLWSYGKQLDADFVATGHYAQVLRHGDDFALHRAADPAKDQTYVLFGLRRSLLPHLLFPIGGFRKDEVRSMAREAGLGVYDKPDSVEICFVPDNDHANFIRQRRPTLNSAGVIVDTAGKVLAEHDGIERFTVGQRKGLGFAAGARRYVLEIVPARNEVVVGEREELLASGLAASRCNWLIDAPLAQPLTCLAKIRYRATAAPAVVTATADGGARVTFAESQSAVTPGQAVVFYDGDRVLGGGWIEQAVDQPDRGATMAAIINDVFGRLEWDDRLGCWLGEIGWPPGLRTEVAIWHPGEDVVAGLRMACNNLAWLQENDEQAMRCVAGELVEVYNDEWSDEPFPIDEDEFIRRIDLVRIAFGEDASMLVSYDDKGMFEGHVIEGEFGPDGTFRGAGLVE